MRGHRGHMSKEYLDKRIVEITARDKTIDAYQIAERLGVTPKCVRDVAKRANIELPPRESYGL